MQHRFKTLRDILKTLALRWGKLSQSSLFLSFLLILVLLSIGTTGYIALEGWSPLEALYATVITITTVGYGDFSPQTVVGRVFSIVFTLLAIGSAGYAISTLAAVVFENERTRKYRTRRKRRMRNIANLQNHMIVCGRNIIAHRASNEFYRRDLPFIFIEPDEQTLKWALLWMHEGYVEKRRQHFQSFDMVDFSTEEDKSVAELADELGILYLLEDPHDEQQLRRAGIEKAKGLIAALNDDLDNMAVILSARDLANRLGNPGLRIVARIHDEWNTRRIQLSGADEVISPNIAGGIQLANAILHPVVGEFWDHMLYRDNQVTRFVDIDLSVHTQWVGITVNEMKQQQHQLIVAIKRNGDFIYAPNWDEKLLINDVLIAMRPER